MTYLALSGGVGGAKLALGLSHLLEPGQLSIVANTGDDFEHLGLRISPDLDTVMYTLANLSNKELGWGLAGETWHFMDALERLEGESWFRLGDQDLATHILRTQMLTGGDSLSRVTQTLCEKLGVKHDLFPMTDGPVRTQVHLQEGGSLNFQHYFVRDRCVPQVKGFDFKGIEQAKVSESFARILSAVPQAIILCPSNPFVSIDPILKLDNVAEKMKESGAPVITVSPIVGGQALKGPAAKMMAELGMPQTALAVAGHYAENYPHLIGGFVLDKVDAGQEKSIMDLGLKTLVTNTVMQTLDDRIQLGRDVLEFAASFRR